MGCTRLQEQLVAAEQGSAGGAAIAATEERLKAQILELEAQVQARGMREPTVASPILSQSDQPVCSRHTDDAGLQSSGSFRTKQEGQAGNEATVSSAKDLVRDELQGPSNHT